MKATDTDILVGALTIHGEARGCTQEGRLAIAHTLLNRAKARRWWGTGVPGHPDHSIAAVCLKPWQYSVWNANDPNYTLLVRLRQEYRQAIQKKTCRAALKALIDALDGHAPDPTGGATHYLTIRLHNSPRAPAWSQRDNYLEIGAHRFFTGID
jgi:spore germination cell wall hydrolase CwlJ-like protein